MLTLTDKNDVFRVNKEDDDTYTILTILSSVTEKEMCNNSLKRIELKRILQHNKIFGTSALQV